eukprot:157367_1
MATSFFLVVVFTILNVFLVYIATSSQSCADVIGIVSDPKQIKTAQPCVLECNEKGSCTNDVINCFPHSSCSVKCSGDDSCNNLTIKSESMVDIQCEGSNSCKSVEFNHDDRFNTKWLLPSFKVESLIDIPDEKIVIGDNFILAKNISTQDVLDDIKLTRMRCFDSGHSEPRDFGASDYREGKGHNVLYCDDCILRSVYEFYQNLLFAMLEAKRKQIVNQSNANLDDDEWDDATVEEEYGFPWDQHIINYKTLESRVVEYIIYGHQGHIGWHPDEESKVTMVIMVSNQGNYQGGKTEFRLDEEEEPESYRMTWGDVVIFDSNTEHQILPIFNGYRHVFVIEWWGNGRSHRNGRTDPKVQKKDLKCIRKGGGWGCWSIDRGETWGDYQTRQEIIDDVDDEEEEEEEDQEYYDEDGHFDEPDEE